MRERKENLESSGSVHQGVHVDIGLLNVEERDNDVFVVHGLAWRVVNAGANSKNRQGAAVCNIRVCPSWRDIIRACFCFPILGTQLTPRTTIQFLALGCDLADSLGSSTALTFWN